MSKRIGRGVTGAPVHGILLARDDVLTVTIDTEGELEPDFVGRDGLPLPGLKPGPGDLAIVTFLDYVPQGESLRRLCHARARA